MQTKQMYFDDTYLFSSQAEIIDCGKDENGPYLVLDSTIFYPKGGGQPPDQGVITLGCAKIEVHSVRSVNDRIHHYINHDVGSCVGAPCSTEGHLLSQVVETMYPHLKASKGHHYPESAYVEFSTQCKCPESIALDSVNREIALHIAKGFVVTTDIITQQNRFIRMVQTGENYQQPCGGTHVKNIAELSLVIATKQKVKGSLLKVSYQVL
jgi:alanyl-tRNA synthetase